MRDAIAHWPSPPPNLLERLNSNSQLIMLGVSTVRWAYQLWSDRKSLHNSTILRFTEEDRSLYYLFRWLEKLPYDPKMRVFNVSALVKTTRGQDTASLAFRPGRGVSFKFQGIGCVVEPVPPENVNTIIQQPGTMRQALQVRLKTQDEKICRAFLGAVLAAAKDDRKSHVYAHQTWGGWTHVRDIGNNRKAILPAGQLDRLLTDASKFAQSESWYQNIGLPYRRRYLFHGLPGTGKTSTALALAAHLNMHVCVLNLSGLDDEKLATAVREAPEFGVVLLEDIDCAMEHGSRKATSGVTMSGLLNVIDGATTPDGSIMVMTTNHRHALDAALIRPGRADYEIEFKTATAEQIRELAMRFDPTLGKDLFRWSTWEKENITMATAQERLLQLNK